MFDLGTTRVLPVLVFAGCCTLIACTSGSSGGSASHPASAEIRSPTAAPVLSVGFSVKQQRFSWDPVSDATYYNIYQSIGSTPDFMQIDGNITSSSLVRDISVHQINGPSTRYRLEACNTAGCTASQAIDTSGAETQAMGYFKASNTDAYDTFGTVLALSGDGNTLAVAAPNESSSAFGIDGEQSNYAGAAGSGAVYIFTRVGGGDWSQQSYVKASNTSLGDSFGVSIALSNDGNTLAVGASLEDSLGTGINGHQGTIAENSANRGAVYVFTRSGDSWSQQAYVKADSGHDNAYFGGAVTLSGDGNTLCIGAVGERTGGMDAGAVFVFARRAGLWSQQTTLKASTILSGAHFGASVKLSGDGELLAVGAPDEYVGTNAGGTVYVFARTAGAWAQQTFLKASNSAAYDAFGSSVALNGDGTTLAVGAGAESSATTGINGNQADRSAANAGAVYVFTRSADAWSQQAYVKASNTREDDRFGANGIALSSTGDMLAVGAIGDDSATTGIDGDPLDRRSNYSGAVYFYLRSAGAWLQHSYVKASNTAAGDMLGYSLSLSSSGGVLAVGAPGESSGATGTGGDQIDKTATRAGAVYLY